MSTRSKFIGGLLLSLAIPAFAYAQDQGGDGGQRPRNRDGGGDRPARNDGGNNAGGDRQGRGNFDPAQWRQRMIDNLKEQLGTSDEEMQVLQPKLEKVFTAQRDARFGGMGFGRGRGGPGGGGGPGGDNNQPQSPVSKAQAELRTALENKDTPAETINVKLEAVRAARQKAQEDLKTAQAELKELLTARQEAVLVNMGMLD